MDPITVVNKSKVSYAQVTQRFSFPTKEQAIIIDSVEGVTIQEYTDAVVNLVGPNNIRFVSKISQGRVCFYLGSKEIADKLTESNNKVNIGSHSLTIRPLISRAKRIILSNVCPIIPHEVIETELAKVNIKPVSPITFIKAGVHGPGYSHILSFRRQLFINPEDIDKVPASLSLYYDNTVYWIYLSTEKLTCFLCKEEGHLAKFCKNVTQATAEYNSTDLKDIPSSQEKPVETNDKPLTMSGEEATLDLNDSMPPPSQNKRALSDSTTNYTPTDSTKKSTRCEKKYSKKQKIHSESGPSNNDVASLLSPAEDYIRENSKNLPLDIDGITDFLSSSFGRHDIYALAHGYTSDIPALIIMLSEISSRLSSRKLRSRIHRIMNRLTNPDAPVSSNEDLSSVEEY